MEAPPEELRRQVSGARWAAAMLIAAVSDAVSFGTSLGFFPQVAVDLATAFLIWAALGWRWAFLVALIPEALPVVSMFPTWTFVILALKGAGLVWRRKPGA